MPAPKYKPYESEAFDFTELNYIGKMLLDNSDLILIERIINGENESLTGRALRVLSIEAGDKIDELLEAILLFPEVSGSFIVGHDGGALANKLPPEYDFDAIAVEALGIYHNSVLAIRQFNHLELHQLVAISRFGVLIIADFGGGLLVTIANDGGTSRLIALMRGITQFVAH